MLSLKWRLYKIFNYTLLAIGLFFLSYLVYLFITAPPPNGEFMIPMLLIILFAAIPTHSIINIVFSIKNFPDKALTSAGRGWNAVSILSNILSAIGLIIFIVAGAIAEFEQSPYEVVEKDQTGKFILLLLLVLLFIDVFVLICQFRVSSFLKNNSINSISSMIDSIGKE